MDRLSIEKWTLLRVEAIKGEVIFSRGSDEEVMMGYGVWNRIGRPDELHIINERKVFDVEV